MKVLVLFVAGVLGCSLAGAVTITRCDLISQLKSEDKFLEGEVLAEIVCDVTHGSKFNTSAVTKQTIEESIKGRKRRSLGSHFGSGENEDHTNGSHSVQNDHGNSSVEEGRDDHHHHHHRRDVAKFQNDKEGTKNDSHPVQNDHGNSSVEQGRDDHNRHRRDVAKFQNVTLYGIFQLPDCVCSNSVNAPKGVCDVSCSSLVDNNIADDIKCLRLLTGRYGGKSCVKNGNQPACCLIQQQVCEKVKTTDYLGKCP